MSEEKLTEQARNKYRNLPEEEKIKKREYGKNRYHSMSEEKLREQARNKYRNLPEEEKIKKKRIWKNQIIY